MQIKHYWKIHISRNGIDYRVNCRNGSMKIFVDADACPVVRIVEEVAEKYRIDVTLLCDTNHILTSDYSEVIVVGAGERRWT